MTIHSWNQISSRPVVVAMLLTGGLQGPGLEHISAANGVSRSPVAEMPVLRQEDPVIVMLTARLLEKSHYSQQTVDDELSRRLLERYLDTLDDHHLLFTKEDLAEFQRYSTTLDEALNAGDLSPAFQIAARLLERQQQRVEYVRDLLARPEQFDFSLEEFFIADRHKLPWPAGIEQARALWRARLKFELLEEKIRGKRRSLHEIANLLIRRYERKLRYLREKSSDEIVGDFLTALAHVYDSHSDFLSGKELQSFAINMQPSLFGIGMVLSSEDGYCTIQKLISGGPAERSGLLCAGDRIVGVAQGAEEPVDVIEMELMKVTELLRGPKGSLVRLTIFPAEGAGGGRREVAVVRGEVALDDQRPSAKVFDLPETPQGSAHRLAVIELTSFYSSVEVGTKGGSGDSATRDVQRLLQKLQGEKTDGIVLDMRRNGGGSLEEAITLAGLFIPEGPIVQVRDARGRTSEHSDTDGKAAYSGPMVVLTSLSTAGSAEIVAAALQDYGRAVLVGDSATHGMGTVQSIVDLGPLIRRMEPYMTQPLNSEAGALKLTVQKFYRVSGGSTQLKGVQIDIVLPSISDLAVSGEASLDQPLPWDKITPLAFESLGLVESLIPELRRRSEARVVNDPEFFCIRRDFERRRKFIEGKEVSLNEATRLREQAEVKNQQLEQRQRHAERGSTHEIVHVLSLGDVNKPGLPAPETSSPSESAKVSAGNPDSPWDRAYEQGAVPDPAVRESLSILRDLIDCRTGVGTQ